jgi:hypothetical protein
MLDLSTKDGDLWPGARDYPDFSDRLVEAGINATSRHPDGIIPVKRRVAEAEA